MAHQGNSNTASGAPRILVVEDSLQVALEVADAVRSIGLDVVGPAPSIPRARRLLGAEVDGALLDVNLGGEEVFPLAEELRTRGIPFVFLTAYAHRQFPPAFAQVPRLGKPVDRDRVESAIRSHLLCA